MAAVSGRRRFRFRDLWRALPGDVMGVMVMRICGIRAPTGRAEVDGVTVLLVEDPRVQRWFRIHPVRNISAQTVGRYVFSRERMSEDLLSHESEHIRQWERWGPLFLAVYLASSGLAFLRRKRPYVDNHFEAAARRRCERDAARRAGTQS